jgi:hypothetical protein
MWPGGTVRQIGLSDRPARLGIDSWAPYKFYKYGLSTEFILKGAQKDSVVGWYPKGSEQNFLANKSSNILVFLYFLITM